MITVTLGHSGSLSAFFTHVSIHSRQCRQAGLGANERSREWVLAMQYCMDVLDVQKLHSRCVNTVLFKVHKERCYGAHRLPAGKTAAGRKSAGVLAVRQRNCSKIDNCYCPRH
ncbi:hypothetical protein SBC1_52560 (plasmid) [Caballeronia sp. SBC1]|nr:hypothetical protein SBC2_53780 [Caballeronia sp. SBC2]QIN65211.1 hypothetical protein SBC1_52560 [Caballeronia sp. SBC1]